MPLGLTSYAVAGTLFLLLAVLLAFGWKGRSQGARFIAAAFITACWAGLLALQGHTERLPLSAIYLAEILRSGAWLFVLLGVGGAVISRPLRITAYLLCGVVLLSGLVLAIFGPGALLSIPPPLLFSHSGLALALCGLVLLEQVYRNSDPAARISLRPLVFGVGGLFAYDLFLYSQAELFRGIGADSWNARGLINALLAPLIAVAVRRNPEWSLYPFVSRQVVFYTGTFVAVGVYLLVMSLGGYYVRSIGGSWGGIAQVVFLAGAVAVLASLVFSSSVRSRMRVFLSKHFYRNKYDYRAEWLRFIQTLSSTEDADIGRTSLRAVAQIFSSPGGILFLAEEKEQRFVPVASWPAALQLEPVPQPVAAEESLPRFLRDRQWIVDLHEYRSTPDIYGRLVLPGWLAGSSVLRMVSPLLVQERLIGFIVLCDPAPFQPTYEDRDLLKTVGQHVAIQIAQHQSDARLAESRQFEAYNRLTAFMMHDLKNSVAQLKLLVANAGRHRHNPDFFDDAIRTIANTVDRMSRLIVQLSGESGEGGGVRTVDAAALAHGAVARCAGRKPVPEMELEASAAQPPPMVRANPDRLASVLENVLRNAQDATVESGSIVLRLGRRDGKVHITVTDSGSGMDERFLRERLFKPFDSTKGSKGMGVGAYQVREYIRSLDGAVEVQSTPGQGTVFSIRLPECPTTNHGS